MEDKKPIDIDVDIDGADIVRESLQGLGSIIPILHSHPVGSLLALGLVGIICSTAISLMYISRMQLERPSVSRDKTLPSSIRIERFDKTPEGLDPVDRVYGFRN